MAYLGEYECKLDSKGRLRLPSALIRQMDAQSGYVFVINRGFEGCLMLYEKKVFDNELKKVEDLSVYNKKQRYFIRHFFGGARIVSMDSSDRILLNKRLLEEMGIEDEVILSSLNDRIEIWAPDKYRQMIKDAPEDWSGLAEDVLGHQTPIKLE